MSKEIKKALAKQENLIDKEEKKAIDILAKKGYTIERDEMTLRITKDFSKI